MVDHGSDISLNSHDILALRLNEYISNLDFIRQSDPSNFNSEDDTFINERNSRLQTLKKALSTVTNEKLHQLRPEQDFVTKNNIAETKLQLDNRIKVQHHKSQPVYIEFRDALVSVYENYITQTEEFSSLELEILQHLNTDKIFECLDTITAERSIQANRDTELKEQINDLENQLTLALSQKEEAEQELVSLREKHLDLTKRLNNVQAQLDSVLGEDTENAQIFADLQKAQETKKSLQADIDRQERLIVALNKASSESNTHVDQLRADLTKKSAALTVASAAVETAKSLSKQLKQDLSSIKTDYNKLQSDFDKELTQQREKEQVLSSHIRTLEDELATSKNKDKITQSDLDRYKQKASSLQEELDHNTQALQASSKQLIDLQNKFAQFTNQTTPSVNTENLAEELNSALQKTFEAEKKALETEINRLKDEAQYSKKAIADLDQTANDRSIALTKQKQLYVDTVAEHQKEIRNLQSLISEARANEGENEMATNELSKKLGELFSREDKKLIPIYRGQSDESDILEWFKEAERVADNNDWDPSQRLRFFSDRLKSEALDWHVEYLANVKNDGLPYSYDNWKHDMIVRFRDESDIERLRSQLLELRQLPEQRVRSYVSKLNGLFDLVHGKAIKMPANVSPNSSEGKKMSELVAANKKLRDDEKKKLLLNGFLDKIRKNIRLRLPKNPNYDDICEAAYTVESILSNKELGEDKSINAVLAGMTLHDAEQDTVLANQTSEILQLKNQVNNLLTLTQAERPDTQLVATVNTWEPQSSSHRSRGDISPSRRDNSSQQYQRSRSWSSNSPGYKPSGNYTDQNNSSRPNGWDHRPQRFDRSQSPSIQNWYKDQRRDPPQSRSNSQTRSNSTTGKPVNSPGFPRKSVTFRSPSNNRIRTCFHCNKRGHVARECWTNPQSPQFRQPRERQRNLRN